MKLFFSNGSVQQVGGEREVESPDSLDFEIRQGNLRYIQNYSSAVTAEYINSLDFGFWECEGLDSFGSRH